MNLKGLSCCIVTYNNEDKIKKVIDNLINILDGNVNYKLYIVDNNSSDNTVKIVRGLQRINDNIVLVDKQNNLGFGSGHNSILPILNSEYHIVLNPDIYIESYTEIKKMITFLNKNKSVGLLSPLILNKDGSIQLLNKKAPTVFDLLIRFISPNFFKERQNLFVKLDTGYENINPIDYASGCFMIFRTEIFKKINGFDGRYFMYMEDADITRKVNEVSKAVFFPNGHIIHEWQRQSHKKIKYTFIAVISLCKYFNKWGWKWY